MGYDQSVLSAEFLAHEVMPRVRGRRPEARLAIVGRQPSPRVRRLDELAGVQVEADVPDMTDWLSRGGLYACPMVAGTGIKNRLLEAMANGVPCVASSLALRGLETQPGRELLLADGAREFADALVALLEDPARGAALGRAGRDYVARQHSWASVASSHEQLYGEVISEARGRTMAGARA
jgi:glycosyltransferase involved in cell wall biosynthesis